MGTQGRIWTAEIQANGHGPLWAWMAYNPKLGAFATDNLDHARRFESKQDVEQWIERMKLENAKPVRMKQ